MQGLRSQTWIVAPHKLHSHQTEKSPIALLPREGSCTWSARRRWPQKVSSWSRRQSEQNGHQILKLCIGKQPKREHCQKRNSTGEHHWKLPRSDVSAQTSKHQNMPVHCMKMESPSRRATGRRTGDDHLETKLQNAAHHQRRADAPRHLPRILHRSQWHSG